MSRSKSKGQNARPVHKKDQGQGQILDQDQKCNVKENIKYKMSVKKLN